MSSGGVNTDRAEEAKYRLKLFLESGEEFPNVLLFMVKPASSNINFSLSLLHFPSFHSLFEVNFFSVLSHCQQVSYSYIVVGQTEAGTIRKSASTGIQVIQSVCTLHLLDRFQVEFVYDFLHTCRVL